MEGILHDQLLLSISMIFAQDSTRYNLLVDLVGTICRPCRNDSTNVPGSVVDCREDSTVLWVGKLGDEQWTGTLCDRCTESDEKSSGDEHVEVDRDALEHNAKQSNDTSNDDSPASAPAIRNVWSDWKSDDTADCHDGREKTKERALGIVKVCDI